jgi:hypothetical protein
LLGSEAAAPPGARWSADCSKPAGLKLRLKSNSGEPPDRCPPS